jgi:hypothetical protein
VNGYSRKTLDGIRRSIIIVTIGTDYPGADVSQPTVFVIILNWNLKDDTIACAESVLAGSYARQRVVVVDNGSQDGSISALTTRFGEAIDLIVNEENVGFARGINVGIARPAQAFLLLPFSTMTNRSEFGGSVTGTIAGYQSH